MDPASFKFVALGLAVAFIPNLNCAPVSRSIALLVAICIFLGLVAQNLITILPLVAFLLFGCCGLLLIEHGSVVDAGPESAPMKVSQGFAEVKESAVS